MLFKLTEYARAEQAFVYEAVAALAKSRGGIVADIRAEPMPRVGTTHITTDDGQTVEFEPFGVSASMRIGWEDIASGNVDAMLATIDEAAETYHTELSERIYGHLKTLTEATGNVVDASGKSVFDAVYEMFETVELTFEDDGSISKGFAIYASPDAAEKLACAETEMTPEQQRKFDALIERKRQEFFARKRRRKLP
jgi:hypothetical protein